MAAQSIKLALRPPSVGQVIVEEVIDDDIVCVQPLDVDQDASSGVPQVDRVVIDSIPFIEQAEAVLLIRILGELGENPGIVVEAIPDDFDSMSGRIPSVLRTHNHQPSITLRTWLCRLLLRNEVPDFIVAEDGIHAAVVYHQGIPGVIGLPQTIEDTVLNDNSAGGQIGLAIGKNRHLAASIRARSVVGHDEPLDRHVTVLAILLAVSTDVDSELALGGRVYGWPASQGRVLS
jgi:hypothetical protein